MDDSSRKDSPSTDGNQGTPRYEVGYCKPPTTTRFQKGKSGNPRGRPKEAKDKLPAINEERMKSILIEEAYRAIKVRDGSREVTIPMIRAVVRSMALAAVKGQARSQRIFTALLQATEKEQKAEHDLTLETAIEYKTQWEDELERLAPANLCSLASAPDLFDDRLEHLACGLECEDIGGKGIFRAKRLTDPVGSDRPFVNMVPAFRSAPEGRQASAL